MLGLASSLQHLLGFVVHSLPFGSSIFGAMGEVLFDDVTGSSCPTFWYFAKVVDIFHKKPFSMPNFPIPSTIGALFRGRGFAKLEDLRIAHVGDQLLRLFAVRINFFGLSQVLQEKLLVRVILKILTVSLRFVSCCWTAE